MSNFLGSRVFFSKRGLWPHLYFVREFVFVLLGKLKGYGSDKMNDAW